MTTSFSQRLQAVQASLVEAEEQLKSFNNDLDGVNRELESFSSERQQYQLLDDICTSLDKLSEMGSAELFWGENAGPEQEKQLERVRTVVGEFQQKIGEIDERKHSLQKRIEEQEIQVEYLNEDLAEMQEQEERAKYDFLVERDERELPYRPMVMPWSKQGEDERRYRKALLLIFLLVFTLSGVVQMWELPEIEVEEVEIPENIKLALKKPPPPPVKQPKPDKPEEEKEKNPDKTDKPKPDTPKPDTSTPDPVVNQSGVMAFANEFSDLIPTDLASELGSTESLSNRGNQSSTAGTRSIVTANASASSGGIRSAAVSRGGTGGAAGRIGQGRSFQRLESSTADLVAEDAPSSKKDGPGRSDEDIQIVFDRYKNALYNIYNRQLRQDPTLKGRMVLQLTIETDGSVSKVSVKSSDMNSPELKAKILARVKRFNFGPAPGVPAVTIVYPIDFLPAT